MRRYGRTNLATSVSCTCSCREICSASIVAGACVNRGLTGGLVSPLEVLGRSIATPSQRPVSAILLWTRQGSMINKLVEPPKVLPHPEPSLKSNTTRLLIRNASHLGIGQVVSTALGILLAAVLGRAFEPAQLGILYIVIAISSFVYVIVDWGQGTYLVREIARGRIDEPELIGSALLIRLATIVFSSAAAVAIALVLGYSGQIVMLTLLAMTAGVPAALFGPFIVPFAARTEWTSAYLQTSSERR